MSSSSITHTLGSTADGGVAITGSLYVSLDLLTDLGLNLVCTTGNKTFSLLLQAGETLLKTGYFLHYSLKMMTQEQNC